MTFNVINMVLKKQILYEKEWTINLNMCYKPQCEMFEFPTLCILSYPNSGNCITMDLDYENGII